MQRYSSLVLIALIFSLGACQQAQQGTDAEDASNPFFRRAMNFTEDQNYYAAIQEYEKALVANPNVAKAHVEMGILYNEKLGDPISAIYHYQKYLNARPNAPDREKIQSYLDKAKIDFAITLPNSPAQNAEEIARINRENVELKQSLAEAQTELSRKEDEVARLRARLGSAAEGMLADAENAVEDAAESVADAGVRVESQSGRLSVDANVPRVSDLDPNAVSVPEARAAQVHVIASGDSLWKIARQFYPDDIPGGVAKIKEANPEKTANEKNLKLGDELIIP